MPVLHAAVCCRFWLPGVACCLPAVLDARHCFGRPPTVLDVRCCESLAGGSGCPPTVAAVRHRGTSVRPGLALWPRSELRPGTTPASPLLHPGPAPEPLRPHPDFIPAPPRNHSEPRSDFIPAPPRNHHRTRSRAGRTSCAGEAAVDKLSKTLAGNLPQSPRNRLFL